jgi:tetratricopeptide (TPR) repeat protein
MVEDLRESLEPLGRLDLLEKVGVQAMDYFATVDFHNQTDEELTRHAQVITQLGEIRIDERQYEAALESFREAYERSAALYRNDPSDSTRLFNRGQAEFWVGYVYWRRGDLEEARTWLTLYFDSTVELASMDPTRQDWALEVVYGQHNLAVLALDAEDLEAARAAFTAEIDVLHQVGRADPDFDPRQRSADAYSWLGNIEFAAGDLHKARANYAEAAGLFQALVDESPDNRDLQYSWSHAANYVAIVQNLTGQRVEAGRSAERVVRVLDDLVQHDPQNMEWLRSSAKPRITGAAVFAAAGSWPQADELLSAAFTILEGMAAGDDTDVSVHEMLADALWLRAWVARATGETAGSRQFLDEARAHLRAIEDRGALNDERRGRLAAALVMEGEIQAAENELTGAQESWQAALAQLSQVSGGADSPYVQDPLARALMWTGQTDRASEVIQRLNQQGYLPIRPWPDVPD